MNVVADPASTDALVGMLALVAKATVLLAFAQVVAKSLRHSGAAARHAVWGAALVGIVALPFLSASLPGWRAPVPGKVNSMLRPITGVPVQMPTLRAFKEPARLQSSSATPLAPFDAAAPLMVPASTRTIPILTVIGTIWSAGVLAVLTFVALGRGSLGRQLRAARVMEDESWRADLTRASVRLDARRPVRLLQSDTAAIPLTVGWLRPILLLPADAHEWSDARRRVVFEHELAHIVRHDCAWEYLAWLATAMWWFHPLAWRAARRLRAERERACDDCVLRAGTPATEYATHLVDVATAASFPAATFTSVVAMASSGSLEERVVHLLDSASDRAPLSRRTRTVIGVLAFATVGTVASAHAGRPDDPSRGAISVASQPYSNPNSNPNSREANASRSTMVSVQGARTTPNAAKSRKPAAPDTMQWPIADGATVRWQERITAGDTLTVRAAMGSIQVDSSPNSDVVMSASRRSGPRGYAADTRVAVIRRGRTIAICSVHLNAGRPVAPCEVSDNWGRGSVDDNKVNFHLLVPPGVHLNLMTGLGDVRAQQVHGTVRALTGKGRADITNDDSATVEAFSGHIAYTLLPGVKTAVVSLKVKHGAIDIALAPEYVLGVGANTDHGTIAVDPWVSAIAGSKGLTHVGMIPKKGRPGEGSNLIFGHRSFGGTVDRTGSRIDATIEKGNIRITRLGAPTP